METGGALDVRTCPICGQMSFSAGPCRTCYVDEFDPPGRWTEELVEAQDQAYWARGEKNHEQSGE